MWVLSRRSMDYPMMRLLAINMFSSIKKNNNRSCTHVVRMCSISSRILKIELAAHNFYINLFFISIHDGYSKEVEAFHRGFECVGDAVPAVTVVTDNLVKGDFPSS